MDILLTKIVLAMLLGGALGLERQYHDKPAGLATNCIICLGAMIFAVMSEYLGREGGDPGRIAAQIVSGVGFLGAGAIMRDGNKISGLTTAAGVWLVAAIGMTIGFGYYMFAAMGTAAALILQLVVRRTINFVDKFRHHDTIYLTCAPQWAIVQKICKELEKQNITILKQEITKQDKMFAVNLVATFTGQEFNTVTKELLEMPEVYSLYK